MQGFELVCGWQHTMKLAMVTTMWDQISQFNSGMKVACEKHEEQLRNEWKATTLNGIKLGRFDARKNDAWAVVDQVLQANGHHRLT
jgi:hypothetical protein